MVLRDLKKETKSWNSSAAKKWSTDKENSVVSTKSVGFPFSTFRFRVEKFLTLWPGGSPRSMKVCSGPRAHLKSIRKKRRTRPVLRPNGLVSYPSRQIRSKKGLRGLKIRHICLLFGPFRPCRSNIKGPNRSTRPQAGRFGLQGLGS